MILTFDIFFDLSKLGRFDHNITYIQKFIKETKGFNLHLPPQFSN
jgi:deoxyribodipyrimidine photolyase